MHLNSQTLYLKKYEVEKTDMGDIVTKLVVWTPTWALSQPKSQASGREVLFQFGFAQPIIETKAETKTAKLYSTAREWKSGSLVCKSTSPRT